MITMFPPPFSWNYIGDQIQLGRFAPISPSIKISHKFLDSTGLLNIINLRAGNSMRDL